ncbi:hypothetical protein ACFFKE_24285 [Streptomyces mutabilis]|uniref:hypothetical protein n=1 Tax=Streptomyces mutabilis TaxID=67332 RepID=UPI0017823358|nr:hypothetical protein [Streptomyces mutabilis]GGQ28114.1 hypothetical protein GCM10010279_40290 [Streptomyces mutabilis]
MRPRTRKAVRAMRQAAREQRWEDVSEIGTAAYWIGDGKDRRLLETYLGPNAAVIVSRRR